MTTEQTTPNIELLRQTMDEILAHPELHNQGMWATETDCGTAYCFAGWVCKLSGLQPDFTILGTRVAAGLTTGELIGPKAQKLLGLDQKSADTLFWAGNETADLKHYVDQIAEHGRILDEG